MNKKQYFVYIITNISKTALYIGVTNDLERRICEHKSGLTEGFSKKYKLKHLVYFEETDCIESAIVREKQLKKWKRKWKEELISDFNPDWEDLAKNF